MDIILHSTTLADQTIIRRYQGSARKWYGRDLSGNWILVSIDFSSLNYTTTGSRSGTDKGNYQTIYGDYTAGSPVTPFTLPADSGGTVTMTFPKMPPKEANVEWRVQMLVKGTVIYETAYGTYTNQLSEWDFNGVHYTSLRFDSNFSGTDSGPDFRPLPRIVVKPNDLLGTSGWTFSQGFRRVGGTTGTWAPYYLSDGRQIAVDRKRWRPVVTEYTSTSNIPENFEFMDDGSIDIRSFYSAGLSFSGVSGGPSTAWIQAASDSVQTFNVYGIAPIEFYSQVAPVNGWATYAYDGQVTVRFKDVRVALWIYADWQEGPDEYSRPVIDTHEKTGITGMAWLGAPVNGASVQQRPLFIATNREIWTRYGTGKGTDTGWKTYLYGYVDARSKIGFEYLPNGEAVLTYETFSGSTPTSVYTINRNFGFSPLTNWSTPANLDPARSAMTLQGHAGQDQTYRFFTG